METLPVEASSAAYVLHDASPASSLDSQAFAEEAPASTQKAQAQAHAKERAEAEIPGDARTEATRLWEALTGAWEELPERPKTLLRKTAAEAEEAFGGIFMWADVAHGVWAHPSSLAAAGIKSSPWQALRAHVKNTQGRLRRGGAVVVRAARPKPVLAAKAAGAAADTVEAGDTHNISSSTKHVMLLIELTWLSPTKFKAGPALFDFAT